MGFDNERKTKITNGHMSGYSRIMKYIPNSKKEAVKDAYADQDGYWIVLKDGWSASRTDWNCHTIHEDTIQELRYQIAGICRCEE